MNRKQQTDSVPSHVRRHLLSHPRSGLSVAQYCKKHSISTWSFYQWRKRYQSKLSVSAQKGFSFNELGVLKHAGCICDIQFPFGVTVSVRRGAPRDELAAIFNLLGENSSC